MAVTVTIWHNPRCSKSRATLALLQERGINSRIRLYLQDPPNAAELRTTLDLLGIAASGLVRSGEADYRLAGLDRDSTEKDLIRAMVEYPKLIERPVVISGGRAVLGRPPENVLSLFD